MGLSISFPLCINSLHAWAIFHDVCHLLIIFKINFIRLFKNNSIKENSQAYYRRVRQFGSASILSVTGISRT